MRVVTVKFEGRTYQIPDIWLAGASRRMGVNGAVRHWHEQELMAEQWRRENA